MAIEISPNGTHGRPADRGLMRLMWRVSNPLVANFYRLMGGRGADRMLLVLTTVGGKSGQERTTPLAYFSDEAGGWLVIASAGGAVRHPSWYLNMARHPDRVFVQIGRRRYRVLPRSLKGAERERHWQRIISRAPQFAEYQRQTDRRIPVVRLTPVE